MSTPQITVLMPVLDGARHIGYAIESALAQTFGDFELLVVDDGSSDASGDIARELARRDGRVRVLGQPHRGVAAALNLALAEARSPLVACLDADDLAWPERFARQVDFLAQHPTVGCVGAQARVIDDGGAVVGHIAQPCSTGDVRALSLASCPLIHSAVLMRKDLALRVGGYRGLYFDAVDYDLWLRLLEVADIANLPETLVDYRVHQRSLSQRFPKRQLLHAMMARGTALARRATGVDPTDRIDRVDEATLRALALPADARAEWLACTAYSLAMGGVEDATLAWVERDARRIHRDDPSGRATTMLMRAHFLRARAAYARGRYADALAAIGQALPLDPGLALRRIWHFGAKRLGALGSA